MFKCVTYISHDCEQIPDRKRTKGRNISFGLQLKRAQSTVAGNHKRLLSRWSMPWSSSHLGRLRNRKHGILAFSPHLLCSPELHAIGWCQPPSGGSSFLSKASLEKPSQTYPGVCLPGDSKPSQVDSGDQSLHQV